MTHDHDVVLTCPRCHEHGLVRLDHEIDMFECVYCKKEVHLKNSRRFNKGLGIGFIPFWLLIIGLFLLVA
jgi:hypothetical protein